MLSIQYILANDKIKKEDIGDIKSDICLKYYIIRGDDICNKAIDEMVDALGSGIANICYVINPEVVVLGGGIMAQEEFLRDKTEESLSKYLIPFMRKSTKLKFAENKNDAGLLGAYYNFRQRHIKNLSN